MKGLRAQAGFTFVELMAVVVIMGILVVIIMPNIKHYTARAKVSEAIVALTSCRTSVSEVYISGSPIPPDTWGCDITRKSQYVERLEVEDDGNIKVFTSPLMGDTRIAIRWITLAPMARSGQRMNPDDYGTPVFRWRCGSTTDGTDIEDFSFLPSSCRGG